MFTVDKTVEKVFVFSGEEKESSLQGKLGAFMRAASIGYWVDNTM